MKIEIPKNCPCCEYPLQLVNSQLFCRNTACPAQLAKKLEAFCKVLQIKGMGPKTLEKLNLGDLMQIFYLHRDKVCSDLGVKVGDKIFEEIQKARGANLATVLEAMSIPLVGGTASKKIAAVVTDLNEINNETCKQAGLGAKVTENLLNWIATDYQEMKDFLPFDFKNSSNKPINENAKRVCITGKLKSFKKKSEAEASLLAAGFILVDSVTKTTDYLVDEGDSMSAKRQKAVDYGITIITDLNDLIGQIN